MDCLDADTVLALLGGELPPAARADAERHVDGCSECRVLLGEIGGATPASAADQPAAGNAAPGLGPMTTGERIGRYVVLEWLGAGGMGVVYSAYDPELDPRVAVKLWRPELADTASPDNNERLLREAKVLAQISHPNVIGVLDVGTHGAAVFLAMEYVDGKTLRQWQAGQAPWRDIVAKYVAAGQGLAAAHAAHVIHRDFKAENVLIGPSTRVRVTDFGLARPAVEGMPATASEPQDAPAITATTTRGVVAGTPAYMAPEQRGGTATAKSDQFSFCVSLYEALYGEHPFPRGDSRTISSPAKQTRVPTWLRAVLLRGLSFDPDGRYGSMDPLLAALSKDPRRKWWKGGGALATLFGMVAIAVMFTQHAKHYEPACRGAELKLAGAWDPARKQALHGAFLATNVPYAESSWRGTERALDDYASKWVSMHTDACLATQVRGEQSAQMLDLRIACLDAHLRDLRTLVDVLSNADTGVVERAVQAAYALPSVDECANTTELSDRVRLPADPVVRQKARAVETVLSRVKALTHAGKYKEGLQAAETTATEAKALTYAPIEATALLLKGRLEKYTGDYGASAADLHDAVVAAERAHDDRTKAESLTELVYVVGYYRASVEEGEWDGRLAQAAVDRLGDDDMLQARLEDALGTLQVRHGDNDAAAEHYKKALQLYRHKLGEAHLFVAQTLFNLGIPTAAMGRYAEALELSQRALPMLERAVGPEHPKLALGALGVSEELYYLNRFDEAIEWARRSIRITENAPGAPQSNLGIAHHDIGVCEDALGKYEEARRELEEALSFQEAEFGHDHPGVATAANELARTLRHLGRPADARKLDARALASLDHPNADPARLTVALTSLGESELDIGKPGLALPLLERALSIEQKVSGKPVNAVRTHFALARALGSTRGDLERARSLAKDARDFYAQSPAYWREQQAVGDWLAVNR